MEHRLEAELKNCSSRIEHWYRLRVLGDLGLKTTDQRLLTEIGVPSNFEPLFVGRENADLVQLQGKSFVRFASEYGADLVIEPSSSRVLSIMHDGIGVRFVNTDFARFLLFICRLEPVWSGWPNKPDHVIDAEVAELRQNMERLDPEAFRNAGTWWSLVFEQFETGQL